MHKLTIKVPIYKITCHIVIAPEIHKVINKFCKRKKWEDVGLKEGEEVHGYAISANDGVNYYIFYDVLSVTANYLTHEISHLIDDIFDEKNIEKEAEARAYLTGYISEKIFDYVLKKSLLINKWYKPQIIENQKTSDEKPRLFREGDKSLEGTEERSS